MKRETKTDKIMLISSMCIFATIGIFRRYIPLSSRVVALARGIIGTAFLIFIVIIQKKHPDIKAARENFFTLLISGAAIGFNWILLFESYCYTSVATATLCYYLAPILVIIAAPFVLKEKLTARRSICAAAALCGMVPVSGVLDTGIMNMSEMRGILCGIGAAILYASVIIMNKKMKHMNAYDKTILQLFFASLTLFPYVLLTEKLTFSSVSVVTVIMLLVVGVLHTGFAYWMYFGSIRALNAQTVALWSYLDPVLAIILSTVLLKEPMSFAAWIGAIVILGAAYISER